MISQAANILLDAKSQPQRADVSGGVNFISNQQNQQMNGVANQGTLLFGADSTLKHAQFRNAVTFVEQVTGLPGDPRGTATRQVRAETLDVDFAPGPDRKSIAQKALAVGNAVAVLRTTPSKIGSRASKSGEQSTTISGDRLLATLANGNSIRQVDGSGHTQIVDQTQDGSTNTSSGDALHLTFTSQQKAVKKQAQETAQIDTAVQTGNVVLTETPAANAAQEPGKAAPQPLRATAHARRV